jgi:hypothetical protein
MKPYRNAFEYSLSRVLLILVHAMGVSLFAGLAYGQDPDFDDLNQQSSNEIVLTIEGEDEAPLAPPNLINIDPVRLVINRKLLANFKPNVTDPRLVHARTFLNGDQIQQGSQLLFKLGYHTPKGMTAYRRVSLFSKLPNPKHGLHEDTEFELNGPDNLDLNWRRHTGSKNVSVATINDHFQTAPRPEDAGHRVNGQNDHYGYVFLETANLKPGDYKFVLKVYRKDGDDIIEKNFQNFEFTLIAAPIAIEAFIPDFIAPYNDGKSLQTGEYEAGVSDWAVPPYRIKVESSVPGFSMDWSGQDMSLETSEALFELVVRPRPNTIGQTARMSLSVTDGLGRTAVTHRKIGILDGKDAEITVTLPQTVNAGQSIMGTVSYPSGFKLKKPPKIGDPRGFEWTNSDYTAFRLTPGEEGVHHTRLFALIASGTMAGMDDDTVLVWKRSYTVKSQDLIYDEERNRRRTEATNRAWREAMGAIASGVGAAAEAYGEAQANQRQSNSNYGSSEGSNEGFYEIIGTEAFGDDAEEQNSGNDIYEVVGTETQFGQTYGASSSSVDIPRDTRFNDPSNFSIEAGDSSEITETSVCGVAILGRKWSKNKDGEILFDSNKGWIRERDDNERFEVENQYYDIVLLTKLGIPFDGNPQIHELAYFKHNCAQAYETIPRSSGLPDRYEFWDNGGKKQVWTNADDRSKALNKEWDRTGNLISHSLGDVTICDNYVSKGSDRVKKCS